jgi:thiosulfate/3-mercaptopyruvate sulfurtransferase
MKTAVMAIATVLIAFSTVARAADDTYPRAEMLVEAQQIVGGKLPATTILLDLREKAKYDAGHIAGARWLDTTTWTKEFGDGRDDAAWSKRIGDLGIAASATVVVYGDQNMSQTCRIWYILRYWGIEDVRVLNGGWKAWHEGKLGVEQATPAVPTVAFKAQSQAQRLATKKDVLDLLARGDRQIVDSRSTGEFCGDDKRANQRGGAIPGAKHLDWVDLVDGPSQRFKSATELRQLFTAAGIDPGQASRWRLVAGLRSARTGAWIKDRDGGRTSRTPRGACGRV